MRPCDADVAILGGGPAGLAAALTLRRYTLRECVVLDAAEFGTPRAGESVSSAILPLLDYLGVDSAAVAQTHNPAFVLEAVWGSEALTARSSVFSVYGPGWNLDRRGFDTELTAAAERAGAHVVRPALLCGCDREYSGRWRLRFSGSGGVTTLTAREVVDATGRRASLARRVGAQRIGTDRLVGIAASVVPRVKRTEANSLLIEAAPNGWWYAAALPGGRSIAVYLTDGDLVRAPGVSVRESFAARFAETAHVARRYQPPKPDAPLRISAAGGQQLRPCIDVGWVAAGDAAASFDPLSALGVGHALSSGVQAARIVHARLSSDDELAQTYQADVNRLFQIYAQSRATYYAVEQRWPDRVFWRRRHEPQNRAWIHDPGAAAERA